MIECVECGFTDPDETFLYIVNGELYCSLHKDKEEEKENA